MDKEVKEDIENASFALDEDQDMIDAWYDYERDMVATRNGEISDAVNDALKQAKEKFEKEKVELKKQSEHEKDELKVKLAKNLKNENIDIQIISRTTGLSISEIEKLQKITIFFIFYKDFKKIFRIIYQQDI